ncbi:hypothetical protein U1763_20775 [Sphingomonas sp. LB2R24]
MGLVADDLAPVAENLAAGRAAAHRLALQPAPRHIGDAHALLLADDALERHHQVVDPAGYHRMYRHPVQPEQFHHVHKMLCVAAQPVDILDDEDVDTAAGDQRQHVAQAGPFHRRAGDAVIAVKSDQCQPVALGIAFGEHALVGDRGGTVVRVVEALAAIGDGSVRHGCGPFDMSDSGRVRIGAGGIKRAGRNFRAFPIDRSDGLVKQGVREPLCQEDEKGIVERRQPLTQVGSRCGYGIGPMRWYDGGIDHIGIVGNAKFDLQKPDIVLTFIFQWQYIGRHDRTKPAQSPAAAQRIGTAAWRPGRISQASSSGPARQRAVRHAGADR